MLYRTCLPLTYLPQHNALQAHPCCSTVWRNQTITAPARESRKSPWAQCCPLAEGWRVQGLAGSQWAARWRRRPESPCRTQWEAPGWPDHGPDSAQKRVWSETSKSSTVHDIFLSRTQYSKRQWHWNENSVNTTAKNNYWSLCNSALCKHLHTEERHSLFTVIIGEWEDYGCLQFSFSLSAFPSFLKKACIAFILRKKTCTWQ